MACLVVAEEGSVLSPRGRGEPVHLRYRFASGITDAAPLDPGRGDSGGEVRWVVPECWRPLQADFRQQVLNRPFADMIGRFRPQSVRIEATVGVTLDLPRIAALLDVPTTLVLPPENMLPEPGSRAGIWLRDAISASAEIERPASGGEGTDYRAFTERRIDDHGCAPEVGAALVSRGRFDYARYEFTLRDHPLLWKMQEGHVRFFEGSRRVLDVACGAGVFLGLLHAAGITAVGVERSPRIVRYARGLGFDVAESDALEYLKHQRDSFDGIYCSHFVEHLEIGGVECLLQLLADALRPGGRVVLVFPDPESIRSQLLGFWRDPEHVRFYHPELIELMGRAVGLDTIWHSHYDGPPRSVVPFPAEPPSTRRSPGEESAARTAGGANARVEVRVPRFWERFLNRLGIVTVGQMQDVQQRLRDCEAGLAAAERSLQRTRDACELLQQDTRLLWQVNQTWAWDDNAVLVMRKPEHS